MAALGNQYRIKSIFGGIKYRCEKHGFSTNDTCLVKKNADCKGTLELVNTLADPLPTLMIQDELHLVRESLGTFNSHYETFLKYFCGNLVDEKYRKRFKYIGATATISRYQDHIWHLYHMNSRVFPSKYPKTDENFYAKVDKADINRIILGFAPYGRSITDGIQQSVTRLRELIWYLHLNPEESYTELKDHGFISDVSELTKMLFEYWISISYTNTKNDSLNLSNAYQNQGNNYLKDRKIPQFDVVTMTGDDTFQDIRNILSNVQNSEDYTKSNNMIVATSTISHGVDMDSFNQMFFFGMPSNTAEYIQAYSRVGRKYTGIVVDIIRLARERDKSYLKNFKVFHENKDSLVEPVPVNRWAKSAIYSTFPGIFTGILIQYYQSLISSDKESLLMAKNVKKALDYIDINELKSLLKNAYGCNDIEKISSIYAEIIESEVDQITEGLQSAGIFGKEFTGDILKTYSTGKKKPMTSLRDIDVQVEIKVN
jgi:hypothetical protein